MRMRMLSAGKMDEYSSYIPVMLVIIARAVCQLSLITPQIRHQTSDISQHDQELRQLLSPHRLLVLVGRCSVEPRIVRSDLTCPAQSQAGLYSASPSFDPLRAQLLQYSVKSAVSAGLHIVSHACREDSLAWPALFGTDGKLTSGKPHGGNRALNTRLRLTHTTHHWGLFSYAA
jgi:hypothetical protein